MRKRGSNSALTAYDATFWFRFRRRSHMHEPRKLEGRCFLVVEDEYLVAADLAASLELLGAEVVGPAGSVAEAVTLVENEGGAARRCRARHQSPKRARVFGRRRTGSAGRSVCLYHWLRRCCSAS